jgi:hypothetical protein
MTQLADIKRIDWFRVIVDLERERWSLERIAIAVDRSKGWVSNLKNIPGTEPRWCDGQLLLGLWSHVTGKDRATVELAVLTLKGQELGRSGSDTGPAFSRIPPSTPEKEHPHGQQERHQRANAGRIVRTCSRHTERCSCA